MSGQNTSSAVMQQRKEPHDSLDYFPTPPWATRALCDELIAEDLGPTMRTVWEPACGGGHMARPLAEYFDIVRASDVHDYGSPQQDRVVDFLWPDSESPVIRAQGVDWIITNPPFRLGAQFIHRGLQVARTGVAMLVRSAFLEGGERYAEIYSKRKPWAVMQFCERVPMVKGRYDPKASTATSYCWIVWRKDIEVDQTLMMWIPPCRKRLEREIDWATS